MENTGLKGILVTLWQRVILSYETTLIGVGLEIAAKALDVLGGMQLPNWLSTIVHIAAGVLALYKQTNPRRSGAAGAVTLLLVSAALGLQACKHVPQPVIDVVNCSEAKGRQQWPGVLAEVTRILEADAVDPTAWQAELQNVVATAGRDLVACALDTIISGLKSEAALEGVAPTVSRAVGQVPLSVELARAIEARASLNVTTTK